MGKKLFRTSALAVQNTPQKHLKHEGVDVVSGFESHRRRMNLLRYVATASYLSALFEFPLSPLSLFFYNIMHVFFCISLSYVHLKLFFCYLNGLSNRSNRK